MGHRTKEQRNAYERSRYAKNLEKLRELGRTRQKTYRDKDRKTLNKKAREYKVERRKLGVYTTEEERLKQAARSKAWYYVPGNAKKHLERTNLVRSRRATGEGKHTTKAWQEKIKFFGEVCSYCSSAFKLTKDHVIPKARGGTDWPANLAPACKSCNCRKHTTFIIPRIPRPKTRLPA